MGSNKKSFPLFFWRIIPFGKITKSAKFPTHPPGPRNQVGNPTNFGPIPAQFLVFKVLRKLPKLTPMRIIAQLILVNWGTQLRFLKKASQTNGLKPFPDPFKLFPIGFNPLLYLPTANQYLDKIPIIQPSFQLTPISYNLNFQILTKSSSRSTMTTIFISSPINS